VDNHVIISRFKISLKKPVIIGQDPVTVNNPGINCIEMEMKDEDRVKNSTPCKNQQEKDNKHLPLSLLRLI